MADDNKNPLDVLEELLNQANSSKGGANSAGGGPAAATPDEAQKAKEKAEEDLAKELEAKRLEFEKQQAEQKVDDEQKLKEHREAIIKIKDTDQYKARVQQDSKKLNEDAQKVVASDGYEINQLDHTKV
jgi:hypothetical protein